MAKTGITVWVGTKKGAFAFRSTDRKKWSMEGPIFRGWEVNHVVQDRREPERLYAAVNSAWFGPHIHSSTDGGKTWNVSESGLALKSIPDESLKRVWHIEPGASDEPGAVYAGGDPGALFKSGDWGASWEEVSSLTAHPTRDKWMPGAGGMCLHSLQCLGKGRMIAAISAAGAFRTKDGGATWEPFNQGVLADFLPSKYPEVGQCVHKLLAHPRDPEKLFQQNHCGIYRGKLNGKKWTDVSKGVPSRFGFGLAVPAAEPDTMFTVPMDSPNYRCNIDGAFKVARTRDGGKNWDLLTEGLPQKGASLTVLREAVTSDAWDEAGVYVGATSGHVFYTRNAGDKWHTLAEYLPPVYSVSVAAA